MKDSEAFGYAYIALAALVIGYAVGRSHGEREQKDRRRDSDLFSLKSQVGWLNERMRTLREAEAEVAG